MKKNNERKKERKKVINERKSIMKKNNERKRNKIFMWLTLTFFIFISLKSCQEKYFSIFIGWPVCCEFV